MTSEKERIRESLKREGNMRCRNFRTGVPDSPGTGDGKARDIRDSVTGQPESLGRRRGIAPPQKPPLPS